MAESEALPHLSYRERALGRLTARDGYHGIALERPAAERALALVLEVVIAALEQGYHPRDPSGHHPADYVTKRFELPGHEGLQDV